MRVLLNMVIRDELDRYLQAMVLHHRPLVDQIFIYDDRSRDLDRGILKSWGVDHIRVRNAERPSFLDDERDFREDGWNLFVEACQPREGDWILGLDADEFWVEISPRAVARAADITGYQSVELPIPEIWKMEPLAERTDGFWGGITGLRMTKYLPHDQRFPWGGMGCGVFPAYAHQGKRWNALLSPGGRILHFGYAHPQDRKEKFERYMTNANNHASTHVQSIMEMPSLSGWIGDFPEVWRGVR